MQRLFISESVGTLTVRRLLPCNATYTSLLSPIPSIFASKSVFLFPGRREVYVLHSSIRKFFYIAGQKPRKFHLCTRQFSKDFCPSFDIKRHRWLRGSMTPPSLPCIPNNVLNLPCHLYRQ